MELARVTAYANNATGPYVQAAEYFIRANRIRSSTDSTDHCAVELAAAWRRAGAVMLLLGEQVVVDASATAPANVIECICARCKLTVTDRQKSLTSAVCLCEDAAGYVMKAKAGCIAVSNNCGAFAAGGSNSSALWLLAATFATQAAEQAVLILDAQQLRIQLFEVQVTLAIAAWKVSKVATTTVP